jgi:hypothetical protein
MPGTTANGHAVYEPAYEFGSPLAHPAVEWRGLAKKGRKLQVPVRCPVCGRVRMEPAAVVRHQLIVGSFRDSCATHAAAPRRWR